MTAHRVHEDVAAEQMLPSPGATNTMERASLMSI